MGIGDMATPAPDAAAIVVRVAFQIEKNPNCIKRITALKNEWEKEINKINLHDNNQFNPENRKHPVG